MRKKGTARRRVRIVKEKPARGVLLHLDKLELELDRMREAASQLGMLFDLLGRRIDGLEARLQAEKLRESVKW